MTISTFRRQQSMLRLVTLANAVCSIALLAYHVGAESATLEIDENSNSSGVVDVLARITSGPTNWTNMDKVVFVVLIVMGMELLGWIVRHSGEWMHAKTIPVRGKHLDELTPTDRLYIGISKAQTGPFVYFLLRFLTSEPNISWRLEDLSLRTVLLPLPVIFIVFDLFYTSLHWALHIKSIYSYVHKHHHIQKAPSRGNEDAINVHPIEFFLGEYNHLWSWFLCCRGLGLRVHALGALVYLIIGGVLAGWNHTRYDFAFSLFGLKIFDSKVHDVHHRIPQSNYGQYTVFWDFIFGTYRPYDPKDRVNPNAQLDPKTGTSIEYVKSQNLKDL